MWEIAFFPLTDRKWCSASKKWTCGRNSCASFHLLAHNEMGFWDYLVFANKIFRIKLESILERIDYSEINIQSRKDSHLNKINYYCAKFVGQKRFNPTERHILFRKAFVVVFLYSIDHIFVIFKLKILWICHPNNFEIQIALIHSSINIFTT